MSAHTAGPWRVAGSDIRPPAEFVVPYNDGSAPAIATVWDRYSTAEPGHIVGGSFEANARLIAAAPDLLAALKGLLAPGGGVYATLPLQAAARIAVAKAEGR